MPGLRAPQRILRGAQPELLKQFKIPFCALRIDIERLNILKKRDVEPFFAQTSDVPLQEWS